MKKEKQIAIGLFILATGGGILNYFVDIETFLRGFCLIYLTCSLVLMSVIAVEFYGKE